MQTGQCKSDILGSEQDRRCCMETRPGGRDGRKGRCRDVTGVADER